MRRNAKFVALVAVCAAAAMLVSAAAVTAQGVGMTRADRQVQQQLENTIVSFTFNDQPLQEAIEFLATLGSVNIVLDKRQAGDAKTVTLKLSNISLETALKLVTEQVGLKWIVKDGIVFISDEEGVKTEPVTVVYDVADLLAMPPNFASPTFDLASLTAQAQSRGGGTGGATGIFGSSDTGDQAKADEDSTKTREQLLQDLVDLIRQVIEPGTWDEGGTK
jgi:hypothetical protein